LPGPLADEVLSALNEAKARLDEVEQKLARRKQEDKSSDHRAIGKRVVSSESIKPFLKSKTAYGR
jgi:hypothetical protein